MRRSANHYRIGTHAEDRTPAVMGVPQYRSRGGGRPLQRKRTAPAVDRSVPDAGKSSTTTFLDEPAGVVCPFPVLVTATGSSLVRSTLPNGALAVTGPLVATATNKDSGVSRTYNIPGPGTFDRATNRLRLFGQSLIVQPSSVGSPFLITTSGQVSCIENQPIDQPLRGHVSHNICAELA